MINFEILVVTNTFCDLSKFDFKFIDIQILDIQSAEFFQYVEALNPKLGSHNFNFFKAIVDDSHDINENKRYAIFKRDYKDHYDGSNLYQVFLLLLIIFPSEFIIEHSIHFQDENGFVQKRYMTSRENKRSYNYEYLHYMDEKIELINEFIQLAFERSKNNGYIGMAIENYLTGYSASHIHFQFITYCMALENLVPGPQELSYRLKRSVAILCGRDVEECRLINKNVTKIYNLRSKLVHGEKVDFNEFETYLVYLNAIVSLLLIELLVHYIPTNAKLNSIITEIGFGNRSMISGNWKHFTLNPLTYHKIRYKELK